MNFPNDEDGQVLKEMYKSGVDFSKPYLVDFFIAVPNETAGKKILEHVKSKELNCSLEQDEETEEWTVYCSKEMMLDYNEIIKVQKLLDEICKPFGGYSDGWGTCAE